MKDKLLPVFLVGFQRSGTNMAVYTLDKSNEVKLFNENNDRAFAKFKLKDLQVICKLLEGENDEHKIALFKPISDTPKSRFWLEELPELKILFCFRKYNDVVNSHVLAFGDEGADVLRNYLNNVQDDLNSVLRKLYGFEEDFQSLELVKKYYNKKLDNNSVFALSWLFMNHLYYDLNLNNNNRVLPVCYEMTVNNPKRIFANICSFIGIEFQSHIINDIHARSVQKESKPYFDKNIEHDCKLLYERLMRDSKASCSAFDSKFSRLQRVLKWK